MFSRPRPWLRARPTVIACGANVKSFVETRPTPSHWHALKGGRPLWGGLLNLRMKPPAGKVWRSLINIARTARGQRFVASWRMDPPPPPGGSRSMWAHKQNRPFLVVLGSIFGVFWGDERSLIRDVGWGYAPTRHKKPGGFLTRLRCKPPAALAPPTPNRGQPDRKGLHAWQGPIYYLLYQGAAVPFLTPLRARPIGSSPPGVWMAFPDMALYTNELSHVVSYVPRSQWRGPEWGTSRDGVAVQFSIDRVRDEGTQKVDLADCDHGCWPPSTCSTHRHETQQSVLAWYASNSASHTRGCGGHAHEIAILSSLGVQPGRWPSSNDLSSYKATYPVLSEP
eukprot:gene9736-biopygen22751